jgi:nucleolar protein 14
MLTEDDADAREPLTHLGSVLSTLDDYKDHVEATDDGENGLENALSSDFVRDYHFGGDGRGSRSAASAGEGQEEARERRTKKEVMMEVMMKSKLAKAEKRKQIGEDEEMLDKLDARFASISQVLD